MSQPFFVFHQSYFKNAIEDIPFTNNIFTEGNVCEIVNKPRVAHLHWSCYGGKYE